MTDHERRLVLRGMSIARGLLKNTDCTHQSIVRAYQQALAEAWNLNDEGSPVYRAKSTLRSPPKILTLFASVLTGKDQSSAEYATNR